ncbi:MAG: hypothetical protein QOG07_2298 [Pseudonocardiales bacterium]|nr:hypothetical protein [Pseudonocardiales bacterium]
MPDAPNDEDELALARQLHRRGVAESSALRPVAAARLLRSALRAVEAGAADAGAAAITLRMQILITLAKVESELHGSAAGLALLDEATQLLDQGPDPQVVVALHNQRGVLMLRFGKLHAAIAEFDRAERFFDSAAALEQANVLLNRGSARMMLGELRRASRDLERCAAVARSGELELLQYMSLHNLGYLEYLRGDLPQALRTMDAAAGLGLAIEGVPLLDRARVLVEAGLVREADEVLADAAKIFRRDRLAQELGETELERARCALASDDVAAARRFAGVARDRFRRRGNDPWRRSAELVLLQGDLAAGRPAVRLIDPALRLNAELDAQGLRLAARAAALIAAEAYVSGRDVGAARGVLATAGPVSRRDPITSRLHTRYVQARLDAADGESRSASRQVRAGLRELSDYQASFGSIDLQTSSAIHGRHLAELGLSLALQDGRPGAVLAAAERARAVSTRLPVVRPPDDDMAADLLVELRQAVESLRAVSQDPAGAAPLLRRRRELERAITARRWTLAGSGEVRRTARLDEIRGGVTAAASTMVVFVEARATMHAVVIGSGRLRLHELGGAAAVTEQVRRARADLDVLAQPRLPGGLSSAVRSSFDRSAVELDRSLLGPLDLHGQRLVVVSTGILGQLPWGTLPSLRGVPVVVAPSATAWLSAMQAPARRRKRQVFAVAGPDLVRADHEVAGVAAAWGTATMHTGEAAARPALARAMARGSVVHVAAHGVHQTENPLFSSLRLADGPMFAHEMDQTARTPEHVVLSACELGLATVRPGDEALGLTSVLLHLGTRSVVAGVARVGDELAAETMIDYHGRLAGGQDSAAALADAANASAAPVPFVCFGASYG